MVGLWLSYGLTMGYIHAILPTVRSSAMEEIAISKFKATCLAVLEKVKQTGQPVLVTRFGHPVAQITPPAPAKRAPKFGTAVGSLTIHGDIVGPITDISDWEAAQDPDEEK
jgi:prevent-host-death family protein